MTDRELFEGASRGLTEEQKKRRWAIFQHAKKMAEGYPTQNQPPQKRA